MSVPLSLHDCFRCPDECPATTDDIPTITLHLKNKVRGCKIEELAKQLNVSYDRLYYFRNSISSQPKPDLLLELVARFMPGVKIEVPPLPAVTWPPYGWRVHPDNPRYFYRDKEVLTEAQLRDRYPTAPLAPAASVE